MHSRRIEVERVLTLVKTQTCNKAGLVIFNPVKYNTLFVPYNAAGMANLA